MKRKRGVGKRKPKLAPPVGAKESIGNVVALNTQDDLVPDDIDSTGFRSRMEFEKPQHGSKKTRQQASSKKQKVVDVNMEDNISSFPETSVGVSANVSRIARSIISKSSRGFASSIREPFSSAQQVPGGGACQKEPNLPHQERQYQDHELKAALEVYKFFTDTYLWNLDGVIVDFLAPMHETQNSISPFGSVLEACSLLLYLLLSHCIHT